MGVLRGVKVVLQYIQPLKGHTLSAALAVVRPILHARSPSLEEVYSPIRCFNPVGDDVCAMTFQLVARNQAERSAATEPRGPIIQSSVSSAGHQQACVRKSCPTPASVPCAF